VRKRAALAFGLTGGLGVVALATVAIPTQTGCSTRQCAPVNTKLCQQLTSDGSSCLVFQGHWADPTTMTRWLTTSTDVTSDWFAYTGQMNLTVYFPNSGRFPIAVHLYVGVTEHNSGSPDNPATGGGPDVAPEFSEAAGQLAVFQGWLPWGVGVTNASCADYVGYMEVDFPEATPEQLAQLRMNYGDTSNPVMMIDGGSAPDDASGDGGAVATMADAPAGD
jgi:hypothetical protein